MNLLVFVVLQVNLPPNEFAINYPILAAAVRRSYLALLSNDDFGLFLGTFKKGVFTQVSFVHL